MCLFITSNQMFRIIDETINFKEFKRAKKHRNGVNVIFNCLGLAKMKRRAPLFNMQWPENAAECREWNVGIHLYILGSQNIGKVIIV